jgi:hypothetical protein
VTALDVVVQRAAFAQRHADHLALGLLGGLADRLGHLFGLALAEADAALLVADDDERGKAEALTALHGLGDPVDRDQAVGEFRGRRDRRGGVPGLCCSRSAMGILRSGGAAKAPVVSIAVGIRSPRIIEGAPWACPCKS